MKTVQFIDLLNIHRNKRLQFTIDNNYTVANGYHITEVMNVKYDTVDCGAQSNSWQETLLQVWQPAIPDLDRLMTSEKSLKIINQVAKIRPLNLESEIFIEYGDSNIRVSKFNIDTFSIVDNDIIFSLSAPNTTCKARDRALLVNAESTACCGAKPTSNKEVASCC